MAENKRPSPDNIVCIDLTSEDEGIATNLKSVRKRLKSGETPTAASTGKKVKTEGSSSQSIRKSPPTSYDDVEVLETTDTDVHGMSCLPTGSGTNDTDNDNDVAVVGTLNHVRLPHMRQHCTEAPFQNNMGYSLGARQAVNGEHCDCCYCYVCDVPVKDCPNWKNDHCLATDQGARKHFWASKREEARKANNTTSASSSPFLSPTATTTLGTTMNPATRVPPGTTHFRDDCPIHLHTDPEELERQRHRKYESRYQMYDDSSDDSFYDDCEDLSNNKKCCTNCICYVCDAPASECVKWNSDNKYGRLDGHCNACADDDIWDNYRYRNLVQELGPGPFAPDHDAAALAKDEHLTKCVHCAWSSRLNGDTQVRNSPRPAGCLDWCHACGRVANASDLEKKQSMPHKPLPTNNVCEPMLFLGTKEISFRLQIHDPRQMEKFATKWTENQGKPGWVFEESEQEQELFNHRFGRRPTLGMILSSIPTVPQDKIPSDGSISTTSSSCYLSGGPISASANETEAVILDNHQDLILLREINRNSPTFGKNEAQYRNQVWLHGDIEATWDSEARSGKFRVRVFAKSLPTCRDLNPISMTRFMGAWFGVFPFKLSELNLNLTAKVGYSMEYESKYVTVPPFRLSDAEHKKVLESAEMGEDQAVEQFNLSRKNDFFALESGSSSKLLGGTNAPETDFRGTLKRYLVEIAADCVFQRQHEKKTNPWLENEQGVSSSHRSMQQTPSFTSHEKSGLEDLGQVQIGTLFDSFLSREDYAVVMRTSDDAATLRGQTSSLTGLLNHLENRGHAAAPFVDGLTVELLPFQAQSLQWAIERETTPGGIQSFFWTKLPSVEEPDTDVYFNPILGKLSKTKPNLVRGGIIAEQMGLGKTVISLALILQNPAPVSPASGSLASAITVKPGVAAGIPFWDPDLHSRTSAAKTKRGSILSRATLVVCNVSLVGQWIEEAKSKLENPGLVYTYHGAKRKRNPRLLAENSIVVTTYETLASDATFHASRSEDTDYCAPCEQVRWWRIICDESHVLRNGSNKKSNAVLDLVADNKWLVSGTPVNTTLMDLKNQLKFLGVQDFGAMMDFFKDSFFSRLNDKAASKKKGRFDNLREGPGFGLFTFFMRSIMMRHSQDQKYTGTNTTLMSLPPKTERVVAVKFSDEERTEYENMEKSARGFYNTFKETKGHELSKHYLVLTQKLTPLRIACSGGQVPLDSAIEDSDEDDEDEVDTTGEEGGDKPKKGKKPQKFSDFAFRSKLLTLVSELKRVREKDSTAKALVFSQYKSTLKYLQNELPKHGFQFRTLSGDMTMRKRAKALSDFQNDPPTTIFLLSMRAGAVGINLTQANCVFLMEPCFNPALEAQAVGRVHRLGQKRSVDIVRLMMEDSVETRIREMLDKKFGARNAAKDVEGSGDDNAEEETHKKPAAKPAATPMVGCIQTDKAAVMEVEFDLLFGVAATTELPVPVPDSTASSTNATTGFV